MASRLFANPLAPKTEDYEQIACEALRTVALTPQTASDHGVGYHRTTKGICISLSHKSRRLPTYSQSFVSTWISANGRMESATYSSSVISLDDDGNRKIAIQLAPWFSKSTSAPRCG